MTTLNLQILSAAPLARRSAGPAYHANILTLCVLTILAAFSLRVVGNDRVAFFFAPGRTLPNVCLCRVLLGINCPGCGLTRSFVSLAHGRWHAAEVFHPMGWMIASVVVFQVPYRIACLLGLRPLTFRWLAPMQWVGLAALFAVWIVRMF